jgi:hypothetical protein
LDRLIEYPSEILYETELLGMQRNMMVALAKLAEACIGTSTIVDGLLVGVSTPAALSVAVAPGSIFAQVALDATAYSSLTADNAHQIVKNGINLDATTLVITPPATAGQSINYLIEAAISETDTQSVTLAYFNSANPAQAFAGVNNNGVPQATVRRCAVTLVAKAGVAAATGSQVTPTPDAGSVGLAVVTVSNGQSTITAGNITNLSTAPRIGTKLGSGSTSILGSDNVWTGKNQFNGRVSSLPINLGSNLAGTVTIPFGTGNTFYGTLAGNITLAAPSGLAPGQAGAITFRQGTGGNFTVTYGSNWTFPGSQRPTLSTAVGAKDVLSYKIDEAGAVAECIMNKAFG